MNLVESDDKKVLRKKSRLSGGGRWGLTQACAGTGSSCDETVTVRSHRISLWMGFGFRA